MILPHVRLAVDRLKQSPSSHTTSRHPLHYILLWRPLPLLKTYQTRAASDCRTQWLLTSLALMAMSEACPLAMLRGWWSMMLALGSAERCPFSPEASSMAPSPNA